ncbi:MAG: FecR domain-containing protein [Deltaproteobacteria bacterium]|nr:FecR domain-containing protein [Deltaproteobacteria bacterium]
MNRRLFQNQEKVAGVQNALEEASVRPASTDESAKRNLIAQLHNANAPASHSQNPIWILASIAAVLVLGAGITIYFKGHAVSSPEHQEARPETVSNVNLKLSGLVRTLPIDRDIVVPSTVGAKFVMSDQSTIWADSETQLMFLSRVGDLNLKSGRLLARFNKRRTPARIVTPNGTIQIIGTVFSVTVKPEYTEVRLFKGEIALLLNGKPITVTRGTYVRATNKTIDTQRPLDTSDVISALLIPEKTFRLSGPPVPELQISEPAPVNATPKDKVSLTPNRPSPKNISRLHPAPQLPSPVARDTAESSFQLPPEDDMQIEQQVAQKQPDSDAATSPPAEQLLQDACDSLKRGDHEKGKAKIRDYLEAHPKDRYWEHVHTIFE